MLSWHIPYLGWTRLPADVSEFEITHFFSLRAEERSAVLTRYRDSLQSSGTKNSIVPNVAKTFSKILPACDVRRFTSFFTLKFRTSKPTRGFNVRACEACTVQAPFPSFLQMDFKMAISFGGSVVTRRLKRAGKSQVGLEYKGSMDWVTGNVAALKESLERPTEVLCFVL